MVAATIKEDTRTEPRSSGFACIGVARTELPVHFYAAYQADNGSDCVYQFRSRVEITGDHVGSFGNTTDTVTLCECT